MDTFETRFENSLQDVQNRKCDIVLTIVQHPNANFISALSRETDGGGDHGLKAWMRPDVPWLGIAAWVVPQNLEKEMIAAGCGALFSHSHGPLEDNEAYIRHLGPAGLQVSGSSWNGHAFSKEGWPATVHVNLVDVRPSRGYLAGTPRPSHWPEPLPMIVRQWESDTPPEDSPDLSVVALCLAEQMRRQASRALTEETGCSIEQSMKILGSCEPATSSPLACFARQEHPMFGASALDEQSKHMAVESLNAILRAAEAREIDNHVGYRKTVPGNHFGI